MRKCYPLIFLLCCLGMAGRLLAQTTVQIGTGNVVPTYTLYSPIYRYSATSTTNGARSNIIFTPAELSAAGLVTGASITSIAFNKTNVANFVTPATFSVYMGNTGNAPPLATNTTWASLMNSHTQVYTSNAFNVPSAAGWVTITLSTPFVYTGGAIEIATELSMAGNGGATDNFAWEYTTGFATSCIGVATATGATLNGTVAGYKHRPNTRFTFVSTACSGTPTAGTATADNTAPVCPGTPVSLGLTGNTVGTGLTFQWESSPTQSPFTPTTISAASPASGLTINPMATLWYRARVVCNNGTPAYATPVQVQTSPGLAGGTYTINSGQPTAGTNYNSFAAAVAAMNCGITGPVIFDVVAGSGPYTELVSIGNISGASAVNTITIRGHGNTVQYTNTTTAGERQLLTLNGTRYLRIDSLTFKALAPSVGWGALITGGARFDSITNCVFDNSLVTSVSSTANVGIAFSASNSSAVSAGVNGSRCYIAGNHLLSASGTGGMYYPVAIASGGNDSNIIRNNLIENYYYYGIYLDEGKSTLIEGNTLHKTGKTASITTNYAIYTVSGAIDGTRITGNRIYKPGGATGGTAVFRGLYLLGDGTAANPVIVSNNVVYQVNLGGASSGVYASTALHNKVYHNTIAFDDVMTGTGINYGIYAIGTNTGTEFKNNVVSMSAGSEGVKYGFYYDVAGSVADAQRNVFFTGSTQPGTQYYGSLVSDYSDITAFQAANPALETGSVSSNPQFVAPAAGNYLPGNYMLYGMGQNLNTVVPVDINGTTRLATPAPGAYEMPLPPINNAGMVALTDPGAVFCAGVIPVSVSFQNAGVNTLTSVQLHWQVDGVAQAPVSYTGSLAAATVIGGQSVDTALLGNVTVGAAPVAIKVWTSQPNGVTDTDHGNDTLSFTLSAAMSGTYTINGATATGGTNYQSFSEFTADLLLKGICGPVTANVNPAAGPYNERVTFGNINGSSAVNTIRVNGNGALVQYANTSAERTMLMLNGSRYVTVDSLVFKTLATDYGYGAQLMSAAAYDSISRCTFDMTSITSTSSTNTSGIVFSASATSATTAGVNGTHCYIGYNKVLGTTGSGGPYYGITISGASDSNYIVHNEVRNFYYYGVRVSAAAGTIVHGNNIHRSTKTSTTVFYGIYNTGAVPGMQITGNRVHSPSADITTGTCYGLYLLGDGTLANPVLVANNLMYNNTQGGVLRGIFISAATYHLVYHNTISIDRVLTGTSINTGIYASGTSTGTRIINNNVAITAGTEGVKYGFYYVSAASIEDAQRNNIYVNSSQPGTQNYGYYTAAYASQAAFQAAYPTLETGSLTVDPQFVAGVAGNLFPLNTALADNGSNLLATVASDVNGVGRDITPTPGAYELAASLLNDAGAHALINPSGVFCSGPRTVALAIINGGVNAINTVAIHWTVNGVAQTPVTYNGPLTGIYSADNIDTVTLGLADFPAGQASEVRAWTVAPNGVADLNNSNDTLIISVQPSYSITVNLGNDTSICAGNSVVLHAGNAGASYLWSNGSTGQTASFGTSGLHYVTVTAADACIGRDTLALTVIPLPVIDLGNDTLVCPGTTLILDAGNPGAAYLWQDGSNSQTYTAADSGTYTVAVTQHGCTGTDAITIGYIDLPSADGINATYGDTATYTFYPLNAQHVSAYTWNFGDGSPEVSGYMVQHRYTQNGIYTVTLQMEGVCDGGLVSETRTVDVFDADGATGIGKMPEAGQWKLFPNPSREQVTIEGAAGTTAHRISIYNIAGQQVYRSEAKGSSFRVTTAAWTPGLYLLRIETTQGTVLRKFEVLR